MLFAESDLPAAPYRVLARKYRPAGFESLIGQDAMVQTLANAIRRGRLAQAWLLTGVRGVGKTSTARIIAKALNCEAADGPTISPCGRCDACVRIAEGNHLDVLEMDAASNTGIDDIREIIESVKYAPASARYKVHIIDEVHMLSKAAFNGLLKTLEEPPPHAKFIFATTEVNKVPVTVLSRCQRFDLKRIPPDLLGAHFRSVAEAEGAAIDDDALLLLARAADGSVRDGLSILDQAIAHAALDGANGAPVVTAGSLRAMLGLADRAQARDLLGAILNGDAPRTLALAAAAHDAGTEPAALIGDLLDQLHAVTRRQVTGAHDPTLPADDRARLETWAAALAPANVHRLWQLLLRGLQDVHAAPVPAQAADMALLRAALAAGLPDPAELMRRPPDAPPALPEPQGREGGRREDVERRPPPPAAPTPAAPPAARTPAAAPGLPPSYAALVALFANRDAMLANQLTDAVGCADYAPPRLTLSAARPLPADFTRALAKALQAATGAAWEVSLTGAPAETLRARAEREAAERRDAILSDPASAAVLAAFPEAQLIDPSTRTAA